MMIEVLKLKLASAILAMQAVVYPATGEFKDPETDTQEYDRKYMVAEAVIDVAEEGVEIHHFGKSKFNVVDSAALITTLIRSESALDYFVHAGMKSHIGPQDGGRAKCLGQIQTWRGNTLMTDEEHVALVGTDREATKRCLAMVLSYVWHNAKKCSVRTKRTRWKNWEKGRMEVFEVSKILSYYAKGTCSPIYKTNAERKNHTARVTLWKRVRDQLEAEKYVLPPRPEETGDAPEAPQSGSEGIPPPLVVGG